MTPKKKAIELIDKYAEIIVGWQNVKQCALIAVDEILESNMTNLHLHQMDYWEQVKQEIEKL